MNNKISIFLKNKNTENSIILAVIISSLWCIGSESPLTIMQALLLSMILAFILDGFYRLFLPRISFNNQYQESKFEGEIDRLLATFYQLELILKTKIGDYYIFTTNYFLLPNSHFVVKDNGAYCVLQSQRILTKYLKKHILLRESENNNVEKNS